MNLFSTLGISLLSCLIVLGIVFNLTLIIILVSKSIKSPLKPSYSLVINLAIADIIYCILTCYDIYLIVSNGSAISDAKFNFNFNQIIQSSESNQSNRLSLYADGLIKFTKLMLTLIIVWTITCMACIRKLSITRTESIKSSFNCVIVSIWIGAIIFSSPVLINPLFNPFNPLEISDKTIRDNQLMDDDLIDDQINCYKLLYITALLLIQFLIPFVILFETMISIVKFLGENYSKLERRRSFKSQLNSSNYCLPIKLIDSLDKTKSYNNLATQIIESPLSSSSSSSSSTITTISFNSKRFNCPSEDQQSSQLADHCRYQIGTLYQRVQLKPTISQLSKFNRNHRVYKYLIKVLIGFTLIWLPLVLSYFKLIAADISYLLLLISPLINAYLYHWSNTNICKDFKSFFNQLFRIKSTKSQSMV